MRAECVEKNYKSCKVCPEYKKCPDADPLYRDRSKEVVKGIKTMLFRYLSGSIEPYGSDELLSELAQKIRDSLIIDEDEVRDIIYGFTQHLELSNADVMILNCDLIIALLRANLIKVKK